VKQSKASSDRGDPSGWEMQKSGAKFREEENAHLVESEEEVKNLGKGDKETTLKPKRLG